MRHRQRHRRRILVTAAAVLGLLQGSLCGSGCLGMAPAPMATETAHDTTSQPPCHGEQAPTSEQTPRSRDDSCCEGSGRVLLSKADPVESGNLVVLAPRSTRHDLAVRYTAESNAAFDVTLRAPPPDILLLEAKLLI